MLRTVLGEIRDGRLTRLRFFGAWILLSAIMMGIGLAIVLAIVGVEALIGGDLQDAQAILSERFGGVAVVGVILLGCLFLFAQFNLMAKRVRDIGLPGWWMVLALGVIGALISYYVSNHAAGSFNLLCFLLLALVPSNALAGR